MRHRAKGRQLSRTASHRRALLRNMAASLFEHEGINTTVAKAKELRPYAEKLVTLARRGDLHAIRQVEQKIPEPRSADQAVQDHRPAIRVAAGWLHPDPQAGTSSRRWRRDGADRAARRVIRPMRG